MTSYFHKIPFSATVFYRNSCYFFVCSILHMFFFFFVYVFFNHLAVPLRPMCIQKAHHTCSYRDEDCVRLRFNCLNLTLSFPSLFYHKLPFLSIHETLQILNCYASKREQCDHSNCSRNSTIQSC